MINIFWYLLSVLAIVLSCEQKPTEQKNNFLGLENHLTSEVQDGRLKGRIVLLGGFSYDSICVFWFNTIFDLFLNGIGCA